MSNARSEMLGRIATALGRPGDPPPGADPKAIVAGIDRQYRRTDRGLDGARRTARFVERAGEYGATITIVEPGDLAGAVAGAVAGGAGSGGAGSGGAGSGAVTGGAGSGRTLAAPGVEAAWLSELPGIEFDDASRSTGDLDGVDTVVTACALAIAETGTVVLDHRGDQGRRALTLVPDHHVCVVREEQIVASVPDAVEALDPRRAQTWISGPSATSDIELDRVVGVHGPRRLDVIVVRAR